MHAKNRAHPRLCQISANPCVVLLVLLPNETALIHSGGSKKNQANAMGPFCETFEEGAVKEMLECCNFHSRCDCLSAVQM